MRTCCPSFYFKFQCLASKCSDTCCAGWEIEIDEKTETLYKNVSGEMGDKLKANIENGQFKLLPNERCPFLTPNNLCEIYSILGKNFLCAICKEHPRFKEWFGDYMEQGLGLCCEEAIRLLLNETSLEFVSFYSDEAIISLSEEDIFFRDKIFNHREKIFSILKNRTIDFKERLITVFHEVKSFEEENFPLLLKNNSSKENDFSITLSHWVKILGETESLGKSWDKVLAAIQTKTISNISSQSVFSDVEKENIVIYLLFRYYAKTLYEGNFSEKFKFALFFLIILENFANELAYDSVGDTKINAIKMLSKQLEYSENNLYFLFEHFNNDVFFSENSFLNLIQYF